MRARAIESERWTLHHDRAGCPILSEGGGLISTGRVSRRAIPPLTPGRDGTLCSLPHGRGSVQSGAFTLVELLVVIAILALLMTVLITVASSVMTRAKVRQTKAVMQNLELAIDQFRTEAPLKRVKDYRNRYGDYPCDELEGFHSGDGIPGPSTFIGPGAPNSDLNYPGNAVVIDVSYQSIKAMALVMRLFSPEATAILDGISPRYRLAPDREEFFDRDDSGGLDTDDEPLIYFVDAWGTAFDYFVLNNVGLASAPSDTVPANGARRDASAFVVQQNRGRPLLVSYGPDGPDQFSDPFRENGFRVDLVYDFSPEDSTPGVIDHYLNADNVYIDDSIKGRLAQGP